MPVLVTVGSLFAVAIMSGVALYLARRRLTAFNAARRPLRGHFQRLGENAPTSSCPCGRKASYGDCCRRADVERLCDDVIEYLWKSWSHRSYAGRRRSDSMRNRMENHRLPRVVLPDWVERPERFAFPIPEETIRSWRPTRR